jgi:hypothetical protein
MPTPLPVLSALDDACMGVAERERASLVVWKEFDPGTAARLGFVTRHAATFRAETPPMHELDARLPELRRVPARRSRPTTGPTSRRSERKFRASGFAGAPASGTPPAIARNLHAPEAHRLYEAVVDRASVKLRDAPDRVLPDPSSRNLPVSVTLTVIARRGTGGRPPATGVCSTVRV